MSHEGGGKRALCPLGTQNSAIHRETQRSLPHGVETRILCVSKITHHYALCDTKISRIMTTTQYFSYLRTRNINPNFHQNLKNIKKKN